MIQRINSEDWPTEFPQDLVEVCYNVALHDSESRNIEDQYEQKDLWIRMHECTDSYEDGKWQC